VNVDEQLPFDLVITNRAALVLSGTGTEFPLYRIPEIEIVCKTVIEELRQMTNPEAIYQQHREREPDYL